MNLALEDRVLLNELAKWAATYAENGVFTVEQSDSNGVHSIPDGLDDALHEPLITFCERYVQTALGKEPTLGEMWYIPGSEYLLVWIFDKSGTVRVSSTVVVCSKDYTVFE